MDNQEQLVQKPATAVLPGFIDLFAESWMAYKEKLGTFLGIMFAPAFFVLLIFIISGGRMEMEGPLWIGTVVLVVIALVVSQILGQVALLCAIRDSQENISISEAYRRGLSVSLSYVWIVALGSFVATGGFFLFIVPGIILSIWFSLAMFILLEEKVKGMDALLKSREYVRGKWWWVFFGFLFTSIFSLVVSFALSFILGIFDFPDSPEITQIVSTLFVTPLMSIYMFSLYRSLKAFKGDVSFVSTRARKAKFLLVGVLGVVLFVAFMVFCTMLGK